MSLTLKHYKELEKPIIFIGCPRSGTSIISEIVMRHKDIGFASRFQDKNPKNLKINYLRRLLENRFWRIYGQKKQLNKVGVLNRLAFKTGENYPMWEAIIGPNTDFRRGFLLNTRAEDVNIAYLRSYFQKIVSYQGKKRLAFKITGPSRIEFLQSVFPDAQFIRIKRNSIATISSLLKSTFWHKRGEGQIWWKGAYSDEEKQWAEEHKDNPVAMTAIQIKKITDTSDYEIKKNDIEVMDVQYVDFTRNPEKTISEILEYTGLSKDQGCFDYFKKNKIYNRNRNDEDYFGEKDLEMIKAIYSKDNLLTNPIS